MKRLLAVLLSGGILLHGTDSCAAALLSTAASTSRPSLCLVQTQAVVQALRASWWSASALDQKGSAAMARTARQMKQDRFRDPWDMASPLRFQSDATKTFKDIEREVNAWTVKKLLTLETRFNQVRNSEDIAPWVENQMVVQDVLAEMVQMREPGTYALEERLREAIRVEAVRQTGTGLRISGLTPLAAKWIVQHEPYFHDIDPPFPARLAFHEDVRARSYFLERLDDVLHIRPEGELGDDPPFRLPTLSKSALNTHPVAFLAAILMVPEWSPALGTSLFYSALTAMTAAGVLRGLFPLLRRWIKRSAQDFLTVFTPKAAQQQFSEMYLEPLDHGVGFQLRSVDQEGESHVEGWVTYENLPVAVFITQIELAAWNISQKSPRLTGVGSLLVKAVLREALSQNKEIRTLPKDPWSQHFFHQFEFAGFWTSQPIMTPQKAKTILRDSLSFPGGLTPISITDATTRSASLSSILSRAA